MKVIDVADGPNGSAFVLVALEGHAQLILIGASKMFDVEYGEAWDKAVRFCWNAGWEPRQDDADMYVSALDAEFYLLVEVRGDPEGEVDDDEASGGRVALRG